MLTQYNLAVMYDDGDGVDEDNEGREVVHSCGETG